VDDQLVAVGPRGVIAVSSPQIIDATTAALSFHRPSLRSRMRRLEHAPQALPAHMGVELGGREVGVSE
jgi:hypothetical protein